MFLYNPHQDAWEALGFLVLSRVNWALFLSILTQNGI